MSFLTTSSGRSQPSLILYTALSSRLVHLVSELFLMPSSCSCLEPDFHSSCHSSDTLCESLSYQEVIPSALVQLEFDTHAFHENTVSCPFDFG